MGLDSQPVREPQPQKTPIVITPKSSHEWLANVNFSTNAAREQIGADILQNARELNPNVHWGEVLNSISWRPAGQRSRPVNGEPAIQQSIASTIGVTAKEMGWNMQSPEAVYMSGSGVRSLINMRLKSLAHAIADIESGVHQFPSDERKQERLSQLTTESGMLGTFSQRIRDSLAEYATAHMPQADPTYLRVLQDFPYMGHGSKFNLQQKAFTAFKDGNYADAASLLQEAKGVNATNSPYNMVWDK